MKSIFIEIAVLISVLVPLISINAAKTAGERRDYIGSLQKGSRMNLTGFPLSHKSQTSIFTRDRKVVVKNTSINEKQAVIDF